MAESVEGSVSIEVKHVEAACEDVEADITNTVEQISCPSESVVESEVVNAQGDGENIVNQVADQEDTIITATEAEEGIPEGSSLPVTSSGEVVASSNEIVAAPCSDDVTTELSSAPAAENIVPENSTEAAEESSQPSNKKRKPEDDEICSDEMKKPKTEDTAAAEEPVQKGEAAVESSDVPTDVPTNVPTPEEKGASEEVELMEAEAAAADSAPAENDIPVEEERIADVVQVIPEKNSEAADGEEEEKDSSENKENVSDEAMSNGTNEKSSEMLEDEATKLVGAKSLDETEAPKEAEAVAS